MNKVNVIGAGAWGTALAAAIAHGGNSVGLWCRDNALATAINKDHENGKYLSGIKLPNNLIATTDLHTAVNADILLNVVPAQHLRDNLLALKDHIKADTALVICAKGIEKSTGKMMSDIVLECLPDQPFGILSGPNFAHEIARGLPAATTLAASSKGLGKKLAEAIGTPTLRPYYTDDIVGAQLGGSVKNVLAIACGVVAGAKLGENARAALITRGMAEILRLGEKLGARAETLMGLSGFGDLVLTCSSSASRNFSLGEALGKGEQLQDILNGRIAVTEGVQTAAALNTLAGQHKIEMPICQAVDKLLHTSATVPEIVEELLSRPIRDEHLAGF
ncbi:MAG: NAD(P)-dependent glycerol-3-phosphate dehydrogenase [Sneathiella sp.]|nr:NAD(P)-dependent glycerol-3-phosphate dehydrogenase [Sneathiella sp.]